MLAAGAVALSTAAPPADATNSMDAKSSGDAKPKDAGAAAGKAAAPAAPPTLAWAEILEREPDPKVVADPELRARLVATGLPWRVRDKSSGIEMLLVPPGKFIMGMSPGDTEALETEHLFTEKYPEYRYSEHPAHAVTISKPFYLGRCEVTQEQWMRVMNKNPSAFRTSPPEGSDPVAAKLTGPAAMPVEQVSWHDCRKFCELTGLRMPTEAQWEYACRAGSETPRYGELDQIAWSSENAAEMTHAVAQKQPNALGFHDMIGNVWEWCSDWYEGGYYTACSGGVVDPEGPASSPNRGRVLRGGSWDNRSTGCRASMRRYFLPTIAVNFVGFRAARNP